ncbi:class III lanthionine synthetase LanKC [Streptomyces sp. NPDC051567]|uniref:class III lanthionine synthetase LanKC n=1 Tax=Streptomyces sp. NPDC051567 TaxID=3365660 RepID=UPI003792784D
MNKGYAAFCDADHWFYDAPYRRAGQEYAAASAPVPPGWSSHRSGDWLALSPDDVKLPAQGWKLHVSACLDNAEKVLDRVHAYCLARDISFKFVPSAYLLHQRNAKYAERAVSGKFLTVYPADEEQCRSIAEDLDALLAGEPGPYILSDLRWSRGPVYLRYGGFTLRHCYDEHGALCPAVEDPDGRLVPDLRGPVFQLPEWVTPPAFLAPHLEARSALTLAGLPYTVERALHFSNGGGVYEGRDTRTGARVVLKEGRPHAGLAADGADAVARLQRERTALERLAGLDCVPAVLDEFGLGDHRFLVLEHLAGKPLNTYFAHRHPLIEEDPDPAALAAYTAWALKIHRLVTEAVEAVHARGVVFNDLHLFNIMVTEDEAGEPSVALLDFEAAAHIDEGLRQTVASPAFVAPRGRRGFSVDRYALACLRLTLFLPLTSLLVLDRAKAAHLADLAAREFPVPRAFFDEAVAEILADEPGETGEAGEQEGTGATAGTGRAPRRAAPVRPYLPVEPGDRAVARASMTAAIRASATFAREDRLFPGDLAQFTAPGGGTGFGNGAAGVLYALAETGDEPWPEAEEWLLARTGEPGSGTPLGFYDGLAGTAWTLDRLGHRERALELAHLLLRQPWEGAGVDLHGGLAGVGLALDALGAATGEAELSAGAQRCAELVALGAPKLKRAGLLHGSAGPALLFLRLYERTGEPKLLDLAGQALHRDLDRCVTTGSGTLQVNEGWRAMPYLGAGSVGIGMVLDDWSAHARDERFEQARRETVKAAQASFYAQPGLFRGVAGMVLHLARTTTPGAGSRSADLARQIDSLARHAVPYQGHLAFPGEQMMRLSMDLSTGTAGVLLALGGAAPGGRARLPFLPPPRPSATAAPEPVPNGAVTPRTTETKKRKRT